jgi:hypothetical protein
VSPSAQAWARNFALQIKCRHCGATYECEQPVITNVKAKHTHRRHVVAFAPESCPEPDCRSLHVVTTASEPK